MLRKGFTLIEVAVVLVVLAILAAIAIPTFSAFMDGVDERALRTEAEAILSNAKALDALDGVAGNDWINDVATSVSEIDPANVGAVDPGVPGAVHADGQVWDNGGAANFQLVGDRGILDVAMANGQIVGATYFKP